MDEEKILRGLRKKAEAEARKIVKKRGLVAQPAILTTEEREGAKGKEDFTVLTEQLYECYKKELENAQKPLRRSASIKTPLKTRIQFTADMEEAARKIPKGIVEEGETSIWLKRYWDTPPPLQRKENTKVYFSEFWACLNRMPLTKYAEGLLHKAYKMDLDYNDARAFFHFAWLGGWISGSEYGEMERYIPEGEKISIERREQIEKEDLDDMNKIARVLAFSYKYPSHIKKPGRKGAREWEGVEKALKQTGVRAL